MKTSIAALTAAAVLAVPGAALAHPADTPPKSPPDGATVTQRVVEPPNRGLAQYRPAAIQAAEREAQARLAAASGSGGSGDGTDTLTVVLIAGGAALAAAGTGFAAGRTRLQRQHGLAS
jgi:hypothetical protein